MSTIFALSSGQPPAAIAIVRISGPAAASVVATLGLTLPPPRVARLARLCDPKDGSLLDQALVLWFPGPHTATGEDLVELHLHGGRAVVTAVERVLSSIPGLERAEPGAFTRRAFANGRIDLAEAEGLGDLLAAETEGQRRNALALADGTISRAIRMWREKLLLLAAAIEARIDFADEDDVPDDDGTTAAEVGILLPDMERLLNAPPAERLRDGIRVVIGGPPNAGKSTLFNALVGREAAIATPIAGTTRDALEFPVQFDGLPFVFVDTAGLRATDDMVEQIGVDRAKAMIDCADIVIWLGDPASAPDGALVVCAQADRRTDLPTDDLSISAVTGQGMDVLRAAIVSRGTSLLPRENEVSLGRRQRESLEECYDALRRVVGQTDILIIAEELRAARAALDRLTGEGGVEPMLDAIFSRFCIGK